VAKAGEIPGVVTPNREPLRCTVKTVQASLGTNPQDTVPILENRFDEVVGQAMLILLVVAV
jgi:hypothetical protein